MSTYLRLPNGDAVSNGIIKCVKHVRGKGVACCDAHAKIIVWVSVVDVVKGQRVRDILIRFMTEKPGIPQPDWSFLDDKEATD